MSEINDAKQTFKNAFFLFRGLFHHLPKDLLFWLLKPAKCMSKVFQVQVKDCDAGLHEISTACSFFLSMTKSFHIGNQQYTITYNISLRTILPNMYLGTYIKCFQTDEEPYDVCKYPTLLYLKQYILMNKSNIFLSTYLNEEKINK